MTMLREQFSLGPNDRLEVLNSNVIRYDGNDTDTNFVKRMQTARLTFNVLLSESTAFKGGGTSVAHLNTTVFPEKGEMLTYYGAAFHGGEPVTRGTRYIWQGFLDVAPGALELERETTIKLLQKAMPLHQGHQELLIDLAKAQADIGRHADA
eukprot:CAMPEP_0178449716 /NCGR_PEP_ID=MMETSP0689_2-20121128/42719_1 /TAXON_ID=160604 /ORGANISM="Amphidinium massartii, Strain CS-259" /LENGTH=151 /DNA_ID=CAMNT_0020075093 /DNA_START=60 /DNA_END=513 /DNA_ORIENTATION=-